MRYLALPLLLATACAKDAVVWSDAVPEPDSVRGAVPVALVPILDVHRQCVQSVRSARDASGEWYATWWSVRPDSSAVLVVTRSSDGDRWSARIPADTADVGRSGCRRTAPSIAADAGSVHVAYAMTAREGAGVFVTHSMAGTPAMFHTPVTLVYGSFSGDAVGRTAIAARGDTVAAAYEDPNSNPPRIGVALSTTMAHLFDWRGLVSPETGAAVDPAIELRADTVIVRWSGPTGRMRRVGLLQRTP